MSMNANEETLADVDASYPETYPDGTKFEYRLYSYVDLYIRIMFLCFKFNLGYLFLYSSYCAIFTILKRGC